MTKRKNERVLIENQPSYKERAYLKFPGEPLEDITQHSTPIGAEIDDIKAEEIIRRNVGKRARFTHNHPTYKWTPLGGPFPSGKDNGNIFRE